MGTLHDADTVEVEDYSGIANPSGKWTQEPPEYQRIVAPVSG